MVVSNHDEITAGETCDNVSTQRKYVFQLNEIKYTLEYLLVLETFIPNPIQISTALSEDTSSQHLSPSSQLAHQTNS